MTSFYGMIRLETINDWRRVIEPRHWKAKRSAYELAHKWQSARGFPPRVAEVLRQCDHPLLKGLRPCHCLVEKPVFLDVDQAPSMTDVMVNCVNEIDLPVVMAVEGKAGETFGPILAAWVHGSKNEQFVSGTPKPSRERRLSFLNTCLGTSISPDSKLRYQLLHRTASAVLEATSTQASAAVMLVHAFGNDEALNESYQDYRAFIAELGLKAGDRGSVVGPRACGAGDPKIPTFLCWVSDLPA